MRVYGTSLLVVLASVAAGCGEQRSAEPKPASLAVRAGRRAFIGAPPVIPHPPLSGTCVSCHTPEGGRIVPSVGVAPANPHTETPGMSAEARCKQCHVFQQTDELFAASEFTGWNEHVRQGERAHSQAPPTVPHAHFMREACNACHSGPAARPEIVCRHSERMRCRQCHVQQETAVAAFSGPQASAEDAQPAP